MSKPTSNICVALSVCHSCSQPELTEGVGGVMRHAIETTFPRKHDRFPRPFFQEFIARHHIDASQLLLPRFGHIWIDKKQKSLELTMHSFSPKHAGYSFEPSHYSANQHPSRFSKQHGFGVHFKPKVSMKA
ncbi:unnamed protein product [Albugo candida]|uniref:Uncharacterized protein n=1 Tax=Albugo candida TaxID=65357 RepID=A0A024GQR2_9STRA|nr:unnamed protein product [Albugo candida]|eukprot:CCI48876.1 unnamed protein product [Albugo candida]